MSHVLQADGKKMNGWSRWVWPVTVTVQERWRLSFMRRWEKLGDDLTWVNCRHCHPTPVWMASLVCCCVYWCTLHYYWDEWLIGLLPLYWQKAFFTPIIIWTIINISLYAKDCYVWIRIFFWKHKIFYLNYLLLLCILCHKLRSRFAHSLLNLVPVRQ